MSDDESRYGPWVADFFELPKALIKRAHLNAGNKAAVKEFDVAIEHYDASYAYSTEGIFTVVYCYEGGSDPDNYDIAELDVYFDDNRVNLSYPPEGGDIVELSIEVDNDFLRFISDMMDENGWEICPPQEETEFVNWADADSEDFVRVISLRLASEEMTEGQQSLLSCIREALEDKTSLMVLLIADSVNCVIGVPDGVTVTLNISLNSGGIAVLMYGETFETFKVSEDYLQFVKNTLSDYHQGGIFYMGEKPPEIEVRNIEDDELIERIMQRICAYDSLADLHDFAQSFLEGYKDYPQRYLMLYPKGFQILCFTESNEPRQFFAYSEGCLVANLDGKPLMSGEEPFFKADMDYIDEVRALLSPHGISFE